MASLKIPDEALPDLKAIAEIDAAVFAALLSAIAQASPTLRPVQFEKVIASKVGSISGDSLRAILGTTFFLHNLKTRAEISASELSEAVISSSTVSTSKDFPLDIKQTLKDRLTLLLQLDKPLGVTAKALDVMTEHDKIYCKARILSDIRPVFANTPEEASAAVIIHNLQLGFHHGGNHEEIYIALDTDDIQALKEVIERAEKKTDALKAMLKISNIPYLEV